VCFIVECEHLKQYHQDCLLFCHWTKALKYSQSSNESVRVDPLRSGSYLWFLCFSFTERDYPTEPVIEWLLPSKVYMFLSLKNASIYLNQSSDDSASVIRHIHDICHLPSCAFSHNTEVPKVLPAFKQESLSEPCHQAGYHLQNLYTFYKEQKHWITFRIVIQIPKPTM